MSLRTATNAVRTIFRRWKFGKTKEKQGDSCELYAVATRKELRESRSKSGIDFVEGSCKPLSDEEVFNVADDIESDAQIENLGVALTFSRHLDIFPGSIACSLSMDSNGQREEDPGRSAAVETNSFSFRPCYEVHTLKTNSETALKNSDNDNEEELYAIIEDVRESSSESGIDLVQGSCKPLSDEEVFNVADDIESDAQIENLGVALTFSRHLDIFPGSIACSLSMDSNGQREEDPGRSAAVEKNSFSFRPCYEVHTLKTNSETALKNSDNDNEEELYAIIEDVRESSSESGIDLVQGSCKPLSDEEVFNVAEDIESDAQIENLGVALTFSRADINRYLGTNEVLGSKTGRGSRMMLFDWRQTVRQRDQRSSFKGALVRAGLVMIADQYFPDVQEMAENRKCTILILLSLSVL